MLQSPPNIPDAWEGFAVFPARFVVYAPRNMRLTVHAFGKTLQQMLLRQTGGVHTEATGSPIREELEALFTELCLVRDLCLNHLSFRETGKLLSTSLARRGGRFHEVVGALPKAFRELPSYPFRAFLTTRLALDDLEPVATLGTILQALFIHEPSEMELASSLAFDLRWVTLVLTNQVAPRGTLASLDREATHLASLADDLLQDLRHPIAELTKTDGLPWD